MKLRAIEPSDLDVLFAIENETSLWPYSEYTVPYSRDALQAYIFTCSNDIYLDRQLRLVVEVERHAVGLVDLCNFSPKHSRAEVSIALLPQYRDKGYGAQALQLLSEYTDSHIHMHQLYAHVSVDNSAAIQAFLKADYEKVAVLKDWIRTQGCSYSDVVVLCKRLSII